MATWPAKTDYATGDVLSATNMNDIGNGLNDLYGESFTNNFYAGKNKIINGDFGIWQRGTTFNSVTNGQYCADRWTVGKDGTNTVNVTQQSFTAGTAPVSGYESQYFIRGSIATTGTLTYLQFNQPIEDVRTFAGQTITVSFWAKGSASATGLVYAEQNFGSGGSANVEFGYPTYSLTTSWARYSVQLTVPSISGKTIGTSSKLTIFIRGGLTANGSTFDLWGVQVEAGSTATPFQTATGTKQGELAACQRYYVRFNSANGYARFGQGASFSTTGSYMQLQCPVQMRTAPTSIEYANLLIDSYGGGTISVTSLTLGVSAPIIQGLTASVASGLTAQKPYFLIDAGSATGYVGFSAEL